MGAVLARCRSAAGRIPDRGLLLPRPTTSRRGRGALARARAGARARPARPPHPLDGARARPADRTATPASACGEAEWLRAKGARPTLLLRRRLVHGRRRRGGVAELGYADCHRDRVPALAPGAGRCVASLAEPAGSPAQRARAGGADHALARMARRRSCRCPRPVHAYFHDTDLLARRPDAGPRPTARPTPAGAGAPRRPLPSWRAAGAPEPRLRNNRDPGYKNWPIHDAAAAVGRGRRSRAQAVHPSPPALQVDASSRERRRARLPRRLGLALGLYAALIVREYVIGTRPISLGASSGARRSPSGCRSLGS